MEKSYNTKAAKKAKVLLLSPIFDQPYRLPPMGIAYLANYFKNHPRIDLAVPHITKGAPAAEEILAGEDYDVISGGGMITDFDWLQSFFQTALKLNPRARRVVGGPITSAFSPDFLFSALAVDGAVVGEGEATFEELVLSLHSGHSLEEVKGIIFRSEEGRVIMNFPRPYIDLTAQDLRPDWSVIDVQGYLQHIENQLENSEPIGRLIMLLGGRGCPYRCHFCGSPLGHYRPRAVAHIISEIKDLVNRYRINAFAFRDETFLGNSRQVEELCQALMDEGIDLPWRCNVRSNLVTESLLQRMKRAGCRKGLIGLESGSDKILTKMNKQITVAQSREAIKVMRRVGIRPLISVMFGYADETQEDLDKTVDLLLELNELPEFISHTIPVPGTVLFDEMLEKGIIPDMPTYLKTMNTGIYLRQRPPVNMTDIPEEIYFETLLAVKRRLFSQHFQKNKASLISYQLGDGQVSLSLSCCHCGAPFEESLPLPRWCHRHFCQHCRRDVWVDLALIPEFGAHFQGVADFLDRMAQEGRSLLLVNVTEPHLLDQFVQVDPWNCLWSQVKGLVGDFNPERVPYRQIKLREAAQERTGAALILDLLDRKRTQKELLCLGFKKEDLVTAFPPRMATSWHRGIKGELREVLIYLNATSQRLEDRFGRFGWIARTPRQRVTGLAKRYLNL
ncbi:MAG: hypothetical protein A2Z73_01575 [Deltaproteobacteria bacterium RBG_13_60_28]|nr:MAG: hypothetical protein A2Z73_01575 [Deltaproteobacteria bacterium RBG_13_60_28]